MKDQPGSARISERLRKALLKPVDPGSSEPTGPTKEAPRSLEELEAAAKSADDKERLIGLIAAPFAAAIGLLVTNDLIRNDPPVGSKLHVSISLYHDLTYVLLALAIAMLATAWFRKRLYLAVVMALYGLAVFNLHYWGFGVPFVMVGAWLMVRSYRFQREYRSASDAAHSRPSRGAGRILGPTPPQASKRYTPPAPRRRSAS